MGRLSRTPYSISNTFERHAALGLQGFDFHCYGTLIDWESGIIRALEPLTSKLRRPIGRDEILEAHAKHEARQQNQTPTKRYSELLVIVCKRLAEDWGIKHSWADCEAYGQSVKDWPAFPDSAEALSYLKTHFKLVVLSNVDNGSFSASNAKLGVNFDAICTAEDVSSYKPDRSNFEFLLARIADIGFRRSDVLHIAESLYLYHDHNPANEFGLASRLDPAPPCATRLRRYPRPPIYATPRLSFEFHGRTRLSASRGIGLSWRLRYWVGSDQLPACPGCRSIPGQQRHA
jgi:2-haloacid dehalogenase